MAKEAEDYLLQRKARIKKKSEEVLAENAPDPILGSKEYQIKHAAIKASRRLKESYRFRKRTNRLSSCTTAIASPDAASAHRRHGNRRWRVSYTASGGGAGSV